jgi:hypothetical protein
MPEDIAAPQPLDSESIRRFPVVADELHYGQAAARLSIAQPGLSNARLQDARLVVE